MKSNTNLKYTKSVTSYNRQSQVNISSFSRQTVWLLYFSVKDYTSFRLLELRWITSKFELINYSKFTSNTSCNLNGTGTEEKVMQNPLVDQIRLVHSITGKVKMICLTYVMFVNVNMMVRKEVYSSVKRLKIEIINKMIMKYNKFCLKASRMK